MGAVEEQQLQPEDMVHHEHGHHDEHYDTQPTAQLHIRLPLCRERKEKRKIEMERVKGKGKGKRVTMRDTDRDQCGGAN